MLRLDEFRYNSPENLSSAVRLLAKCGPTAKILAGGTDLLPKMKRRQTRPGVLIDIGRIRTLSGIRKVNGATVIGAGTTLEEISQSPALGVWAALRQAAAKAATPAIRNRATLGGNLCQDTRCRFNDHSEDWRKTLGFCLKDGNGACHAAPGSVRCRALYAGDLAPALIALKAQVKLVGTQGERRVALEDLYLEDGKANLVLRRGDILTEAILEGGVPWESVYLKLRRRDCFDFPSLAVAAGIIRRPDKRLENAQVALGGIASAPVLVEEACRILVGRRLTAQVIQETAAACARAVKPVANTEFPPAYLRQMAGIFVSRALTSLAEDKVLQETM